MNQTRWYFPHNCPKCRVEHQTVNGPESGKRELRPGSLLPFGVDFPLRTFEVCAACGKKYSTVIRIKQHPGTEDWLLDSPLVEG